MTNYRIIFTENDVSLPDGACVGIMGEHNAVQLVITLPSSMVIGMSFHTVTVNGTESAPIVEGHENMDGAYRSENTLYFPLTAAYTAQPYIDLYVTAFRQTGDAVQIIDKTVPARGLRLLPSNPGIVPVGGTAAEIYYIKQKLLQLINEIPGVTIAEIDGGLRVTFANAEHPEGQSFDIHEHGNKVSLDKIIVAPTLRDLYASTGYDLEEGTVVFITGIDHSRLPFSRIEQEKDTFVWLTFAESVTYWRQAETYPTTDYAELVTYDQQNFLHVFLGLVPIESSTAEQGTSRIGMTFVADQNERAYLVSATCDAFVNDQILADFSDCLHGQISAAILLYAFEDLSGRWKTNDGTVLPGIYNLSRGWNLLLATKDVNDQIDEMYIAQIDPNQYYTLSNFNWDRGNASGTLKKALYDAFMFDKYTDSRGMWVMDEDGFLVCAAQNYSDRLSKIETAIRQLHTHTNKETLDKISEANGIPKFAGKSIYAYIREFLSVFDVQDGELFADTSTGFATIDENGNLHVDTDVAARITNHELEVVY